jgi:hypothetical protein
VARRLAPDRAKQFAATSDCHFQFKKRRQLFIRVRNEMLSVVAMRVNNPDRSPGWNQSLRPSPNSNLLS